MTRTTLCTALVLALGLTAGLAHAASYTVVFGNLSTGAGTTNLGNPHATLYTVTSKFNQPRNVNGTNPHRGTDLGSPYGTNVLAPWNGWVSLAAPGSYELTLYLDINNDGLKNDNAYMKFDHLSAVLVGNGAKVTKGQTVGRSGDEGGVYAAHLHFGVMKDLASDGTPDVWIRNDPYYRTVSGWDFGKMLDFIAFSTFSSNKAGVTCYAKDAGGKQDVAAADVVFYHRKVGSTWWNAQAGTKAGDVFTFDLSTKYPAGTQVQWLVRAHRTSIKGQISYTWAYHPPKFNQPDSSPNTAPANQFDYFVNTVQ